MWGVEDYYNLAFDVYFKDEKVGRVVLRGNTLVENICYFDWKNFERPWGKYPLILMRSGEAVRSWLADRVVPEDRANIGEILSVYGLKEYNVYRLCEKTHGTMIGSANWIKFDHIPDDGKTWEEIRPRD